MNYLPRFAFAAYLVFSGFRGTASGQNDHSRGIWPSWPWFSLPAQNLPALPSVDGTRLDNAQWTADNGIITGKAGAALWLAGLRSFISGH